MRSTGATDGGAAGTLLVATLLFAGRGVTDAGHGVPLPAEAAARVAALDAAGAWAAGRLPSLAGADAFSGGLVAAWEGLWMALLGPSPAVAVAAGFPFQLLLARGLYRGGAARGGALGGLWALVAGLGSTGLLAAASGAGAALPACAFAATAARAALEGKPLRAAGAALLALLLAWHGGPGGLLAGAPAIAGPAGVVEGLVAVAGPAALGGVLLGLLLRGDAPTLGLLAGAAGLAGLTGATGAPVFLLAAVPLLALAGAGAPLRVLALACLVGAFQPVVLHLAPERGPAALRRADAPDVALDGPLDWLVAHAPGPGARVAVATSRSAGLHPALVALRAAERGLPLRVVPVDAERPLAAASDLGLVLTLGPLPTGRDGWRAQLPPPAVVLDGADGARIALWDRGLPEEALLAAGDAAALRNHPREQALWVYLDGEERGPLIPHASSPAVLRGADGWEAVFVRDQALWRARSPDGLAFAEATPLRDATGPIVAFDPDLVALPDGRVRLYAAALVGDDTSVDPAAHPTRILSWTGPSLDALVQDPGERLRGQGLVDPSVALPTESADGAWSLFVTEERARIARATSPDGLAFARTAEARAGVTVPEVLDATALIAQVQVMGWTVLARVERGEPDAPPTLLELCGTGAARIGERLYYTRAEPSCPPPVALPDRRGPLDALLGAPPTPPAR